MGKILSRRDWLPTPVFLPRELHGQRSLAGCSPCGCKEWDTQSLTNQPSNIIRRAARLETGVSQARNQRTWRRKKWLHEESLADTLRDQSGSVPGLLPERLPVTPLLSRSGGEKGLRGSGAGTLAVPLGGTRRVGGLLGVAGRLSG